MFWKVLFNILSFLFVIFAILLLSLYWIFPSNYEFSVSDFGQKNYNFSLSGNQNLQFYKNLRYPSSTISYRVSDACTLQKKYDAEQALEILENQTTLNFRRVSSDEEITIACDDRIVTDEKFFVAGEGGPTNITKTENFNVISKGRITLLRESNCERPNVAIHEFLHALGFDHSSNPNNIMYNITKCDQIIGDDLIDVIDELYSIPSLADLSFEDASVRLNGRLLDFNASIRNNGLKDAGESMMVIYVDDKKIKEVPLSEMEVGTGISIVLGNILVAQLNVNDLRVEIKSDFDELNKDNNILNLEIKK